MAFVFYVFWKLQTAVVDSGQREETESLNSSIWSQPEVTSTQIPASSDTPAQVKGPESKSYKTHSLQFLVNHKEFCKRYKLMSDYNVDSVREHLQQVNNYLYISSSIVGIAAIYYCGLLGPNARNP